jgi:hypothetical protein
LTPPSLAHYRDCDASGVVSGALASIRLASGGCNWPKGHFAPLNLIYHNVPPCSGSDALINCRGVWQMIGDPFLNYFALGLLAFVVVILFYGVIAIHDIPAKIAEARHHPHADAIHAAGWVSLFTLHVLWPFLWIWAMAYRPERGWGFSESETKDAKNEIDDLRRRVAELENQRTGARG